jgi:hypothetical protein
MKGVQKSFMTDIIKTKNELDNYGALTEQMPQNATKYNFKKMREYCKINKKTLSELTEAEIEQFIQ